MSNEIPYPIRTVGTGTKPQGEPYSISIDQARDALAAMGISRDVTDLESVSIEIDKVVITRRRRTDDGAHIIVRSYGGSLATVTTEIPLVGDL